MPREILFQGTVVDDRTGDTLREAAKKINNNFNEIYNGLGDGSTLQFDLINQSPANNDVLLWDANTGLYVPGNVDLVTDTTPRLFRDLNLNGHDIVSVNNGDILLTPDGNGQVEINNPILSSNSTIDITSSSNKLNIGFPSTDSLPDATLYSGLMVVNTELDEVSFTARIRPGADYAYFNAIDSIHGLRQFIDFNDDGVRTNATGFVWSSNDNEWQVAPVNLGFGDREIMPEDIRDGAITETKIADGLLTSEKFAPGTFSSAPLNFPIIREILNDTEFFDPEDGTTIRVRGEFFQSIPFVDLINTSGRSYNAPEVTFINDQEIRFVLPTNIIDGPYFIRVENPTGLGGISATPLLTVSPGPEFVQDAGILGYFAEGSNITVNVEAFSDSRIVSYSLASGQLPPGLSLSEYTDSTVDSTRELKLQITGTENAGTELSTSYNFEIEAEDSEGQTARQRYQIIIFMPVDMSANFNSESIGSRNPI